VLENDTSGSGDFNLNTLQVTTPPTHGTATVHADGTITYSPESNFSGEDRFSYKVCDTQDADTCSTALVTVTVRPILIDLVKTVDKTAVSVGEILTYTISLTNKSLFTLEEIRMEDIFPESLTYISSSPAPSAGNTWTFADMASGEQFSMTIDVL